MMKPDTLWPNNLQLLNSDGGQTNLDNCEMSSLLHSPLHEEPENTLEYILFPHNQYKVFTINNMINTENEGNEAAKVTQVTSNKKEIMECNFENILYYVCNLCPFLCTKEIKITEHLKSAHTNKVYKKLNALKCPACINIFYHKASLRSHLIHDHGVGNSDINLITQAVASYSNKHLDKTPTVENKVKINEKHIDKEKESHYRIKESGNNLVEPKVNSNIHLNTNSKEAEHNEQKIKSSMSKVIETQNMYKCDLPICKMRFPDSNKLNYHLKSHYDGGFKCVECQEVFSLWKTLSGHLWRTHKIDMGLYACDKCDYKTYSLAKLNNIHKLIHSDYKGYQCNECDKAFKNIKQLRNHKLSHTDKKLKTSYACKDCKKSFPDKRLLKAHRDTVHDKLKLYLCNFCGYKGSTRSSLKLHMRQHTGEKPFACDVCNYVTSDHNSLRRHNFRHTGQKPYKCTYCSYACIQSSTYKVHLKTKHPGLEKNLMYTCLDCQFRSINKDVYNSHLVTVHQKESIE